MKGSEIPNTGGTMSDTDSCKAKLEGGRRICGAPRSSTIHFVNSTNPEIRMAAHAFEAPGSAVFAVGGDSMGWRTVHVVDEHGCELHTEPVCSYHVKFHPWFENWILAQEVPNQGDYPALLWHPVLGETSETYKDK